MKSAFIDTIFTNSILGKLKKEKAVKNRKLVNEVAKILSQDACTRKDFMFDVCAKMEKYYGYTITCTQKGVKGTEVMIDYYGIPEKQEKLI